MYSLVYNELYKIFKKKSIYALVIVLVLVTIMPTVINKFVSKQAAQTSNWKNTLISENQNMEKSSGLSKLVLESQDAVYRLNSEHIEKDIPPTQGTALGIASSASEYAMIIAVILVVLAGGMVSKEYSSGSYKMLFTKNKSRFEIITAKILALLALATAAYVIIFIGSYLVAGIFYGFDILSLKTISVSDNNIVVGNIITEILKSYGIAVLSVLSYMSLAFMISALTRKSEAAITTSIVFLLMGGFITQVLAKYSFTKYILMDNTSISGALSNSNIYFSIVIMILYIIAFLGITYIYFGKKDLT